MYGFGFCRIYEVDQVTFYLIIFGNFFAIGLRHHDINKLHIARQEDAVQ